MSSDDKSTVAGPSRLSGTQFLDELERKHNHVLDELDALNSRIENVLRQYAESRQTAAALSVVSDSSTPFHAKHPGGSPVADDLPQQYTLAVRKAA